MWAHSVIWGQTALKCQKATMFTMTGACFQNSHFHLKCGFLSLVITTISHFLWSDRLTSFFSRKMSHYTQVFSNKNSIPRTEQLVELTTYTTVHLSFLGTHYASFSIWQKYFLCIFHFSTENIKMVSRIGNILMKLLILESRQEHTQEQLSCLYLPGRYSVKQVIRSYSRQGCSFNSYPNVTNFYH